MIDYIYKVRYTVADVFLFFFAFTIFFRTPFDRMLKMMLELQLMVNLALMRIHIPGNAMLGLEIIKPMSEFRFQKEFKVNFYGYDELQYVSEEPMAYFGQRYTFGYDTYNLLFNIGTLGHITIFFMFFVLFVYCLFRFQVRKNVNINDRKYF